MELGSFHKGTTFIKALWQKREFQVQGYKRRLVCVCVALNVKEGMGGLMFKMEASAGLLVIMAS